MDESAAHNETKVNAREAVPSTSTDPALGSINSSSVGDAAVEMTANMAEAATYKTLIIGRARANYSNIFTEENFYLLQWLYRIRRASCARGLRIEFLQPDFLCIIYGPTMRSQKLWRTDGDIRVAADLWCFDRAAAEERYGHISEWDVSSVTDMSELFNPHDEIEDNFRGKDLFNDDISRWDVSGAIDMHNMFYRASAFNQPVGNWNVSNVTDMCGMFEDAQSFNQPVGDWDVSNVTIMSGMFGNAHAFNQPIGDWDVSNVAYTHWMFNGAEVFNQDLTRWDMRSVKGREEMFTGALAMQSYNKPASLR
jgi:surface protein